MDSSSAPLPLPCQDKKPWSLTCICWLCILAGVVPAVVLWIVNNRRLGLSPSLLTRVFLGASLAIFALVVVRLFFVEEGSPLMYRLRFINFVMTAIIAWKLFSSQREALVRYCKAGGRTDTLKWPFIVGLLWILVLGGVGVGVGSVQTDRDYKEFEWVANSMQKEGADLRKAERYFQGFKRKYPEETSAYWNLAIIYTQTDRIAEAKKEVKELLKLEPDNKEARDYLGELEAY